MSESNPLVKLFSHDFNESSLNIEFTNFASLITHENLFNTDKKFVFIFTNQDHATSFSDSLVGVANYPGIGSEIYSSMNSSSLNLSERFSILQRVLTGKSSHLVTTHEALSLYTPPPSFFGHSNITLQKDEIYSPEQLSSDLINVGYARSLTVEEEATFSKKGEIFDIYPMGSEPLRITYFDEIIESIYYIDPSTQKSLKNAEITEISLASAPLSIFSDSAIQCFKNKLPRVNYSNTDLYEYRKNLIRNLNDKVLFDDYPLFLSYFFDQKFTLNDYLTDKGYVFVKMNDSVFTNDTFKNDLDKSYSDFLAENLDFLKPEPSDIYQYDFLSEQKLIELNTVDKASNYTIKSIEPYLQDIDPKYTASIEKKYTTITKLLYYYQNEGYQLSIYYKNSKTLEEIRFILETNNESLLLHNITFINSSLPSSFINPYTNEVVLSDSVFFSHKTKRVKRERKSLDSNLFAEQLSTLEIGDYVVHKDHGIGKYLGTETLSLANSTSDYIVLSYKDDDKIYVPVYKMSLLQKHSSASVQVTLANLKTTKFDQAKSKAKQSVKKLAFDLLELQAKRQAKEGYQFSEPGHEYNEFELSFPYEETPDQKLAIENIISDMTSIRPMDRLVCGDVGFGKTEIAMRAAFLAVLDNKQVAILVPTTVLAYQHFNSFKKRFSEFPVNIEFISRFKTAKEANEVAIKLEAGKIDILIGTHKLLNEKFKFKNLGLLVIDEEQRFGVSHKEKLKLIKENVDSLTLTATPIPRTLHQSFLGIKELSIIKTAPPRRQSIKTYVIKEDVPTLRIALEKELSRGGQIFVVHNKVNDIENYTAKIRLLVPKARAVFAHGQMNERQLEKIISDFYDYKYDILVSTTIIESGIDIPRANTMIIDQANNYGLSQLHQLRGRIGRSDKKAYAYFVIPSHKKLSDIAAKRLRAIQTYAELGSGFSLASTDLEIRGSGDVLGAEQSGHINDIGLELYTELLREAISELKGETPEFHDEIEISTPFSSYIPDSYISAASLRLKYYKVLSGSYSLEELADNIDSIIDQFGSPPEEFINLTSIIKGRIFLSGIALKSIKVRTSSIVLQFNQQKLNEQIALRDNILSFFSQRPKIYKLNPDYSINCKFKDTISIDTLLDFSEYISKEFNKA